MTDEEMAEEYAIENWEHYEEGQNDSKALKQAFLAGFKAGRETEEELYEQEVYAWKEIVLPKEIKEND